MVVISLTGEMALNRTEWKKMINVPDPNNLGVKVFLLLYHLHHCQQSLYFKLLAILFCALISVTTHIYSQILLSPSVLPQSIFFLVYPSCIYSFNKDLETSLHVLETISRLFFILNWNRLQAPRMKTCPIDPLMHCLSSILIFSFELHSFSGHGFS